MLNRNNRSGMFAGVVEQLAGDLNSDVSAAQYLKGNTGHYIFISTISTYRDNSQPNADETAATLPLPDGLDPYTLIVEKQPGPSPAARLLRS